MAERNYYVIDEGKCLFPAMTKEQTLTAITEAVESGKIRNVDTGFVTTIKEINGNSPLRFWVGTAAEYNAIKNPEQNCFYILSDEGDGTEIELAISELLKSVQSLTNAVDRVGVTLFEGNISCNTSKLSINVPTLSKYNEIIAYIKADTLGTVAVHCLKNSAPSRFTGDLFIPAETDPTAEYVSYFYIYKQQIYFDGDYITGTKRQLDKRGTYPATTIIKIIGLN